jgi:U11/U12 small nuclear ribonucleoprotein SNRNP35
MEYSCKTSASYPQFAKDYGFYDPLRSGSIDGALEARPHDHGIVRALNSGHYKPNLSVKSDPDRTLFIGRISYKTDEKDLEQIFARFGSLVSFRLVRDVVTGFSKGYAFAEYKHRSDAKYAHEKCFRLLVDDRELLVEFEHERSLKGWVPRRLGGGLGGCKESGQLRFGGRYKPFVRMYQARNLGSRGRNGFSTR